TVAILQFFTVISTDIFYSVTCSCVSTDFYLLSDFPVSLSIFVKSPSSIFQMQHKEECQQFVVNTLALATNRDGSSGGVAYRVSTEEKVILGNDLPTFFDQ
uniref:Uncharacterized protein n=1 Tax=Acanthochromis polyacanthus TaxID=80966 RepID=A0A3Q1F8R9_9TELE